VVAHGGRIEVVKGAAAWRPLPRHARVKKKGRRFPSHDPDNCSVLCAVASPDAPISPRSREPLRLAKARNRARSSTWSAYTRDVAALQPRTAARLNRSEGARCLPRIVAPTGGSGLPSCSPCPERRSTTTPRPRACSSPWRHGNFPSRRRPNAAVCRAALCPDQRALARAARTAQLKGTLEALKAVERKIIEREQRGPR